jgi:hypothetical protein
MSGIRSHLRAALGSSRSYALCRSASLPHATQFLFLFSLIGGCASVTPSGPDGAMIGDAAAQSDGAMMPSDGGNTVGADAMTVPGMLECGSTNDIEAMPARTWCRVAGSKMRDVVPTGELLESVRANSGPFAIMAAWGSAAFDTTRNRLIVWGGGHMDYAGNEVYVFDVASLAWSRLNDPSTDVGGVEASGYYPDGLPRARHTYNTLAYLPPPVDRFCSFGGAAFFPSGQTGNHHTVCFDFETLSWSRRADTDYGGNTIGAFAAFDETTGHYFAHGGGTPSYLAEYAPGADEWTRHVEDPSGWTSYHYTAAIDPAARRLVAIGGGAALSWDLDHPELAPVSVTRSGEGATPTAITCPGFQYDPVAERLVAWASGGDVYTLDVAAGTWARVTPAAGNVVVPDDPTENGTRGRFRYVPSLNVYVLVNSIDSDVYFYRLVKS